MFVYEGNLPLQQIHKLEIIHSTDRHSKNTKTTEEKICLGTAL